MSRESLLGQPGGAPAEAPGDAPRERHPDGSWRADALGRSRHARLSEHLREPLDDRDPARAREICAEAARGLLGDLAPALMLMPPAERFRTQVLATWARTLFDFARQTGVEGERLAALNRLGYGLEQSLAGEPPGQPVFVGLALEESRRPWPREALDALLGAARRVVVSSQPETVEDLERDTVALASALVTALAGRPPDAPLAAQGAGLIRLRAVLDLGETLRRDRAALPASELPPAGDPRGSLDRGAIDAAVRSELARLRPLLADRRAAAGAPPELRPAARYLRRAGATLAARAERIGWEVVSSPPRLGLGARLRVLALARLGR
jgi:hypothetical protein